MKQMFSVRVGEKYLSGSFSSYSYALTGFQAMAYAYDSREEAEKAARSVRAHHPEWGEVKVEPFL